MVLTTLQDALQIFRWRPLWSHRICHEIGKTVDWPEWARTDEFNNLFSKKGAVAKASVYQLAQLLTALVRKERFCSGTMACAFSDGLLTGITHRASMFL